MKVSGSLQKKNGTYYAVIRIETLESGTKQKWKTTKIPVIGKTKRETDSNFKKANKFLQALILEYEEKDLVSNKTFFDWIDKWMESKKRDVRLNTYESYEIYVDNHIKPFFKSNNFQIDKITPLMIQSYIDHKIKSGQSSNSIRKHFVVIKGAFDDAYRLGAILKNPCDKIKLPKKEKYIGQAYTVELAQRLLSVIHEDVMETPITIALYLGLRRSEVIGLRWCDVDFDNDTISISNTIVRTKSIIEDEHTKSLASKRILSMHPALKQHLLKEYNQQLVLASKLGEDYQDTNNSVTHVCVWKTNGKQGRVFLPCYISKHFHTLLVKNKLPIIRFHELRHTAGSILINSGASIKQVQKYLGHEKASVTLDTYIHINQSKHKESSDLLGNQLSKTC